MKLTREQAERLYNESYNSPLTIDKVLACIEANADVGDLTYSIAMKRKHPKTLEMIDELESLGYSVTIEDSANPHRDLIIIKINWVL